MRSATSYGSISIAARQRYAGNPCSNRALWIRCFTTVMCLCLIGGVTSQIDAQQLDAEQARALDGAQKELKTLSVNFNLALSSAGGGTAQPKGSKAKLSKLRLDLASQSVPKVQAYLDLLPADHSDVKTVQQSFDDAVASIDALNARLKGEAAPKEDSSSEAGQSGSSQPEMETKPSTDAATPSTVRLDYKQVESLKSAKYHLRTVEGGAAELTKVLSEIQKINDPETVNYRAVKKALVTLEDANRKSGFANDHLQNVPANGEGVAETVDRLKKAIVQLELAGKTLTPLDGMLSKLVDPANYPKLASDLKRLRELGQMFGDGGVFASDPPRAAVIYQQAAPAVDEANRIAKTYLRLIQQQTEEGTTIEATRKHFVGNHTAFLAASEKQVVGLPDQIGGLVRKIKEMATGAVANKKPLFFTVGIPQQMGFLQQKLDLLTALNLESGQKQLVQVNLLKDELKEQQKSLAKLIIENNKMPNDAFAGADRDKAIEIAVDAWKYQQKDFEVLTKRVPAEAWARETRWEHHNGTWYFVDRSKLAVYLIVADEENAELAIIRPVTVIKDHQKGDTMIGTPLYSGDDELTPNAYMLRSKIK